MPELHKRIDGILRRVWPFTVDFATEVPARAAFVCSGLLRLFQLRGGLHPARLNGTNLGKDDVGWKH